MLLGVFAAVGVTVGVVGDVMMMFRVVRHMMMFRVFARFPDPAGSHQTDSSVVTTWIVKGTWAFMLPPSSNS